jgi:predicted MFS family arabinose efflux permease
MAWQSRVGSRRGIRFVCGVAMITIESGRTTGVPFGRTVATPALVGMVIVGQLYATIPLLPQIGEAWHISPDAATWATSTFAFGYALGSLTSGYLSKRCDIRSLLAGSVALMALVTALVPIGDSLGDGSTLRASQGILAGAFLPVAYSYLNARIPSRRLPLALTTVSCVLGGTAVAILFADSVVGLGVALCMFVMGISVVSPAIAQTVGNAAGGQQSIAVALYDLMLNLGSAAGVHLPSLLPDLADLATLIAAIIGVGAVVVLVTTGLSRRRVPAAWPVVGHSTT